MENNQIERLNIQQFKSIKNIDIECKRINVFIGKPNVGKSNILEAISLLGASYSHNEVNFLSEFIRYEEFSNLFYDDDINIDIQIKSDLGDTLIYSSYPNGFNFIITRNKEFINTHLSSTFKLSDGEIAKLLSSHSLTIADLNISRIPDLHFFINENGNKKPIIDNKNNFSPIKNYNFRNSNNTNNQFKPFLIPPFGDNLFEILSKNKELGREIAEIFKEYGLDLVFRNKEKIFEVQKNINGIIYSYPYNNMADTLQRIIFYLAAIESNKSSVLIFEEPEAHAFPPYTKRLAERIAENEENQFFITTHSPYLLHTLIENTAFEDLNVFVTYYEDFQTKVQALNQEQFRDILDDSIDIFFNLDKFTLHHA